VADGTRCPVEQINVSEDEDGFGLETRMEGVSFVPARHPWPSPCRMSAERACANSPCGSAIISRASPRPADSPRPPAPASPDPPADNCGYTGNMDSNSMTASSSSKGATALMRRTSARSSVLAATPCSGFPRYCSDPGSAACRTGRGTRRRSHAWRRIRLVPATATTPAATRRRRESSPHDPRCPARRPQPPR